MKQKNFVAYIVFYLMFQMLPTLMIPSIPFWARYIIGSDDPSLETLLSIPFLLGSLISIPIWFKFGRKIGNRKAYIYSTVLTTIFFIPLLFISDLIFSIAMISVLGAGFGAVWMFIYPGFSDVIDELVVKSGKRREGVYTGIRTFIGRLATVLQAVIFAIVHLLTLYEPGAETQAALALWGIRIIMVLFPMIFYIIAFLIMVFIYDITPEKVDNHKALLKEMNL